MKTANGDRRDRPVQPGGERRLPGDDPKNLSGSRDQHEGDHARWLTSEQAGMRLGLGRQTLAEWRCERRTNQPPWARFGAKACRYNVAALDAWAAAQIVDPAASSHT
jgi:hypothetical protein